MSVAKLMAYSGNILSTLQASPTALCQASNYFYEGFGYTISLGYIMKGSVSPEYPLYTMMEFGKDKL